MNRYNSETDTLVWTDGQGRAFRELVKRYEEEFFNRKRSGAGLGPSGIPDPEDCRRITAFIAWTAWTASARRPGQDYSYTNNWPPEPLVGNHLTKDAVVWSVLSLIALLGGIGLLAIYGRYPHLLGWQAMEERRLQFVGRNRCRSARPSGLPRFFFAVAALLLAQTLLGGATAHYHAEDGSFFGLDLARVLPYNLARTWHLQLALFVVSAAFLAGGIFLAPLIAGRESKGQGILSYVLLGAAGGGRGRQPRRRGGQLPRGAQGEPRPFFGAQGWEYLDLGRFWQILLIVGMLLWIVIMFAASGHGWRPTVEGICLTCSSTAHYQSRFYAVGLACSSRSTFAIGDFWRFWVVHLWVEDFLELFTTILVAYIFVLLGVVSEKLPCG